MCVGVGLVLPKPAAKNDAERAEGEPEPAAVAGRLVAIEGAVLHPDTRPSREVDSPTIISSDVAFGLVVVGVSTTDPTAHDLSFELAQLHPLVDTL